MPALEHSPPPTVPGIPIQNSTPLRLFDAAVFAKAGNINPDPTVIEVPLTAIEFDSSRREIVRPSTPRSSTNKLEPAPSTWILRPFEVAQSTDSGRDSKLSGSANYSADPPIRKYVRGLSGSCSLISAGQGEGLMPTVFGDENRYLVENYGLFSELNYPFL